MVAQGQNVKRRVVLVMGSVIILAIAAYVTLRPPPESPGGFGVSGSRYFWDTAKGEIFNGPDVVPPISRDPKDPKAPPVGVWAHVFACGDCKDANARHVVYLRTWPDEAASELKKLGRSGTLIFDIASPDLLDKALVKRHTDKEWYSVTSDKGRDIVSQASEPCPDGNNPVECASDLSP